jgi:FixJ family two-component response regulator
MKPPIIGLVDDDAGMLQALERLLIPRGFQVHSFPSAEDFLIAYREKDLDCVVLDLSMPGLCGLHVQEHLRQSGNDLPVVFLSGAGDIPTTVRAIKGGAVNFLTKPVNSAELLNSLRLALIQAAKSRATRQEREALRERFALLTPRENEVLRHVIAGKLNKQIAADLGNSEQTVKIHRMRVTEKTGLHSVAELVRAANLLELDPAE